MGRHNLPAPRLCIKVVSRPDGPTWTWWKWMDGWYLVAVEDGDLPGPTSRLGLAAADDAQLEAVGRAGAGRRQAALGAAPRLGRGRRRRRRRRLGRLVVARRPVPAAGGHGGRRRRRRPRRRRHQRHLGCCRQNKHRSSLSLGCCIVVCVCVCVCVWFAGWSWSIDADWMIESRHRQPHKRCHWLRFVDLPVIEMSFRWGGFECGSIDLMSINQFIRFDLTLRRVSTSRSRSRF